MMLLALHLSVVHLLGAVASALSRAWRLYGDLLHIRRVSADIPGPRPLPLLGNFLTIAGPVEDVYDKVVAGVREYGLTYRLWLGPVLAVLVMHPDDVAVVLNRRQFERKAFVYKAIKPLLGDGLGTLDGEVYQRHRKVIAASLNIAVLKRFVSVFHENAETLVTRVGREMRASGSESDGDLWTAKPFDFSQLSGYCSNQTAIETVLSTDLKGSDLLRERERFVALAGKATRIMMYRAIRPWLYWDFTFQLFRNTHKQYEEFTSVVHGLIDGVLGKRSSASAGRSEGGGAGPAQPRSFLDGMLMAKAANGQRLFTQIEMYDELKTLMGTSSGTSMDSLSFVVQVLAIRQDIQEKVYQELQSVLGPRPEMRGVEFPDLHHFRYLDRVIKETLRYFPLVPVFARQCDADTTLPSGYTLPRGCIAVLFPWGTHRHERWFPDAEVFDPDRFLPENSAGRHPYAFIPFSGGARSCVGQRYAMMYLKTVLATLLSRLRFLPDPAGPQTLQDVKVQFAIDLSVRDGPMVIAERREAAAAPRHSEGEEQPVM